MNTVDVLWRVDDLELETGSQAKVLSLFIQCIARRQRQGQCLHAPCSSKASTSSQSGASTVQAPW